MAQRVYLETVKAGLTATDRRLFYASAAGSAFTTSEATSEPTLSSDGFPTLGVEVVHLLFQFAANTPGADSVQVQVWWWSSITGQWHAGESPVADITESTVFTVESLGLERVYLQVKNPVGDFTLGAWAARVVPT